MTENKANEIFRTKYPTGQIFRRDTFGSATKGQLAVMFEEGGKVYKYNATNYVVLLQKLGFNVLYKKDYDALCRRLETWKIDYENGGYDDPFGLLDDTTYDEETMAELKAQIDELQKQLDEVDYIEG